MKFYLKTRKHFLLSNTEMDCPERLRSLHQWRHWKPNRMWSWATSCSRPCVDRWHGLSGLQKFLPIFNNNSHRRSLYFQVYHLKIKHPRTKPEETGESISFYQYWQILASVIYRTFSFSTVWFHVILNSVLLPALLWIHSTCVKVGGLFMSSNKHDLPLLFMQTQQVHYFSSFEMCEWPLLCYKHSVTNND